MKFIPCNDQCAYEGTHCEGCGRSHKEITETKVLVMGIVNFAQQQDYDNIEEFAAAISKSVIKKFQAPS